MDIHTHFVQLILYHNAIDKLATITFVPQELTH